MIQRHPGSDGEAQSAPQRFGRGFKLEIRGRQSSLAFRTLQSCLSLRHRDKSVSMKPEEEKYVKYTEEGDGITQAIKNTKPRSFCIQAPECILRKGDSVNPC